MDKRARFNELSLIEHRTAAENVELGTLAHELLQEYFVMYEWPVDEDDWLECSEPTLAGERCKN